MGSPCARPARRSACETDGARSAIGAKVAHSGPLWAMWWRRRWRAGPYSPSRRDRRLLASVHDSEATAVPARVSLLRPAAPGRRAALGSGRQDLSAVREAHRRPVRERAVGLSRVTSSGASVACRPRPGDVRRLMWLDNNPPLTFRFR